jgi:transcriptional regulator with XRE-family HTH domain
MGNEHLHEALIAKRMAVEDIVHATGVDPRTVQRWLKGRVPHPRHRSKIAQLLNEREDSLWPLQGYNTPFAPARTAEIVAAYAHRSDVPPSAWWQLFLQAKKT